MALDYGMMGLALGAGMVAFFNPCGFALLPSYVAQYLGSRASSSALQERWWERLGHGVALGGVVSVGFFTVFLALGIVIALAGTAISSYLPWAAVLVGGGLVLLGVFVLLGREPNLTLSVSARSDRWGVFYYYVYGIGYALASCGCTLPIFMIYAITPALTTSPLAGLLNFGAYASGMTLMMLLLSVSMAYSKGSLDRRLPLRYAGIGVSIPVGIMLGLLWASPQLGLSLSATFSGAHRIFVGLFAIALPALLLFQVRRWERAAHWLNGILLFVAGLYLIYYQLVEYGLLR